MFIARDSRKVFFICNNETLLKMDTKVCLAPFCFVAIFFVPEPSMDLLYCIFAAYNTVTIYKNYYKWRQKIQAFIENGKRGKDRRNCKTASEFSSHLYWHNFEFTHSKPSSQFTQTHS